MISMSQHGTTYTAPATSNAIRGAKQSGNIDKQRFARMVDKVRGLSWQFWRLDKQVVGSATLR